MSAGKNNNRNSDITLAENSRIKFLEQLVGNLEIVEKFIEDKRWDSDILLKHIERVAILFNERKVASSVEEIRLARKYGVESETIKNSLRNLTCSARNYFTGQIAAN